MQSTTRRGRASNRRVAPAEEETRREIDEPELDLLDELKNMTKDELIPTKIDMEEAKTVEGY